jgi:hypothetical protein
MKKLGAFVNSHWIAVAWTTVCHLTPADVQLSHDSCAAHLRTEYTAPSHSATAASTSPSSGFVSAAVGSTTELNDA